MSGLNIVVMIGLGILSVIDIKNKKIHVYLIGGFAIICFLLRWVQEISLLEVILGILPGIVLLLLAIWSGEKIGIGDGFVVSILGMAYTIDTVISILGISFFLIAICSIVLLIAKKVNGKTELPFLPYLFLGNLLMYWIK